MELKFHNFIAQVQGWTYSLKHGNVSDFDKLKLQNLKKYVAELKTEIVALETELKYYQQ